MKYLLDTCTISNFIKGVPGVVKTMRDTPEDDVAISTITVMEIHYGLHINPEARKRLQNKIDSFLEKIHIISFTKECAIAAAQIRGDLKKIGLPIGPYDILIAGTAVADNLTLVTANKKEFQRVKRLRVEDW